MERKERNKEMKKRVEDMIVDRNEAMYRVKQIEMELFEMVMKYDLTLPEALELKLIRLNFPAPSTRVRRMMRDA